jgi:EAL domain-containing protein (putative c-di-GMP-specific phosphodiesterase class I)/CRP-like cAMP-binding protein
MKKQIYPSCFDAGVYLFHQGDAGDCAFIVEKGMIEVYVTRYEQKMIIAKLGPGSLLGEMSIIDDLPRSASAIALEPSEVIVIPADHVKQKIEYSDPTVRFFLKVIMERYRDMHARLMQVFEGVSPEESGYTDLYDSTSNVMKQLMMQYLNMQDRILTAVNTARLAEQEPQENQDLQITRKSLDIEKSLADAIDDQQFELFYQPIVNLEDRSIVGCEALIRWRHPVNGMIPPFQFIPQAEATGLIIPMGYWIVETACRFQQEMAQLGHHEFFVNVNLSGKQFEENDLTDRLSQIVRDSASNPGSIKFEITESLLMSNPDLAEASLNQLKESGVHLAIDDFGTGYSSLSYLHRFPFDTLKIDRSFVSTMLQNRKSNEIVKSLVDLSHNLGMSVVAEGVETEFEEQMLRDYRCEFAQGFYYARPMPVEAFKSFFQASMEAEDQAR